MKAHFQLVNYAIFNFLAHSNFLRLISIFSEHTPLPLMISPGNALIPRDSSMPYVVKSNLKLKKILVPRITENLAFFLTKKNRCLNVQCIYNVSDNLHEICFFFSGKIASFII